MATTCAQCGVPMQLWAGKLECFGLDCCTTGAAVVALAQSIRSFARRARVGELRKDIERAVEVIANSASWYAHDHARDEHERALTELVTMAKESNR
jgi:hypothetical protein